MRKDKPTLATPAQPVSDSEVREVLREFFSSSSGLNRAVSLIAKSGRAAAVTPPCETPPGGAINQT